MTIFVNIALATLCFTYNGTEECHPVLLGKNHATPAGEFIIRKRITADPGYGGDVLQFYEDDKGVYAIHRVWVLKPEQKRRERLKSNKISDRYISSGCINVDEIVYQKLTDCCAGQKLIIE